MVIVSLFKKLELSRGLEISSRHVTNLQQEEHFSKRGSPSSDSGKDQEVRMNLENSYCSRDSWEMRNQAHTVGFYKSRTSL